MRISLKFGMYKVQILSLKANTCFIILMKIWRIFYFYNECWKQKTENHPDKDK